MKNYNKISELNKLEGVATTTLKVEALSKRNRSKLAFLALLLIVTTNLFSQGLPSGAGGESNRIEGKAKFLPIPYVGYDRAIGFSGGGVPMVMFNLSEKDTISPSSIAGISGIYAQNKTWFGMGFGKLFMKEDTWRLTAAVGTGEINYQFQISTPIDIWIPYNTKANFLYAGVDRKIIDNLYGGINYVYTAFKTETEILPVVDTATIHGLGLNFSYDKRGNFYYPKSGYLINLNYKTVPGFLGNDYVSNSIDFNANYYHGMRRKKDVIATRLLLGVGIGDLSFNQQYIVGRNDIRGYSKGAYRGNHMVALQSEYRWNFHERLGMVGFVGLATIFDAVNEDDNGKILPGVGTGIRVKVQKDTNFNIGLDVAKGIGDWSLSFMISEAF